MRVVFEQQIRRTANAATFVFVPNEPLVWVAGQSIKIALPGPYGQIEHRFTIAAAPYAGKIEITTRNNGSQYKKRLFALEPGAQVEAFAVEGTFTWREHDLPLAFAAAGIGVTPYISMLRQRVYEGKELFATLLYGSPSSDVIYKDELDELMRTHPEFTVTYKRGERLTANHILQATSPASQLIYLSGSSAMVDELSDGLMKRGVPEAQLVRDWFTGKLPQDG